MMLQILITLFVFFAISRVWLRYRDGSIGVLGTAMWTLLWLLIAGVAWWPAVTTQLAHLVGVKRGVDAVVYLSIVVLLYGLFRLYVKLEFIEHELTSLVRNLALREGDRGRAQK
ncbi:MAG: DUF2304 family protein [Candidatus Kerfeldbacteria bacterium]|nr:DUF2304 family protein [Candidatus Kerfeldbacteria bacterium]